MYLRINNPNLQPNLIYTIRYMKYVGPWYRCGLIYKLLIYNVHFIGLVRASSHRLEICETSFTYSSSVMVIDATGSIFLIFAIGTLLYNQVDAILPAKINFFFEMCKKNRFLGHLCEICINGRGVWVYNVILNMSGNGIVAD